MTIHDVRQLPADKRADMAAYEAFLRKIAETVITCIAENGNTYEHVAAHYEQAMNAADEMMMTALDNGTLPNGVVVMPADWLQKVNHSHLVMAMLFHVMHKLPAWGTDDVTKKLRESLEFLMFQAEKVGIELCTDTPGRDTVTPMARGDA